MASSRTPPTASLAPPPGATTSRHGLSLLQRFHFDIALSGSPTALPSLLAFAPPGHVHFGSDWPYAPDVAVAGFTTMYETYDLEDDVRTSIDRGAAEALFPRLLRDRGAA